MGESWQSCEADVGSAGIGRSSRDTGALSVATEDTGTPEPVPTREDSLCCGQTLSRSSSELQSRGQSCGGRPGLHRAADETGYLPGVGVLPTPSSQPAVTQCQEKGFMQPCFWEGSLSLWGHEGTFALSIGPVALGALRKEKPKPESKTWPCSHWEWSSCCPSSCALTGSCVK
jgi:hypothetical protein